jgi:hypothetical protein
MIISNEHVCVFFRNSLKKKEKKTIYFKTKKTVFSEEQFSLSSPKPTEHYVHNVRPPTNLTYQRVTPKILSRQTSYSPLSIQTSMTGDHFSGLSRGSQIFLT